MSNELSKKLRRVRLEESADQGHRPNLKNEDTNAASKGQTNKSTRKVIQATRKNPTSADSSLKSFKSSKHSTVFRELGNKTWQTGKSGDATLYYSVHAHYSKAMAYALQNSEEYVASCINRAVLFLSKKIYDYALIDIDRVLNGTGKVNDDVRAKALLKKSECLKMLGDSVNASSALQEAKKAINSIQDVQKKHGFLKNFRTVVALNVKTDVEKLEPIELPRLKENMEIPCASDAVKIDCNEEFGRHLRATRKIKTGEILIIEDIYYGFVDNHYLSFMYCSHCLKLAMTSVPCNICKSVSYCSEDCKELAWDKYHDVECKVRLLVEADKNYDPLKMKSLAFGLRFFIKAIKEEGIPGIFDVMKQVDSCNDKKMKGFSKNGKFESDKFSSVYSLSYKIKTDDLKGLKNQFDYLFKCFKSVECEMFKKIKAKSELYHELKKLYIRLQLINFANICQRITVSQGDCCICNYAEGFDQETGAHRQDCMRLRGGYLAPVSGLMHFNCCFQPNVNQFIFNGKLVTYSCRPIDDNEQLFNFCPACKASAWFGKPQKLMSLNHLLKMKICDDPSLKKKILDLERLRAFDPNSSMKIKNENCLELLKILPILIDTGYEMFNKKDAAYATFEYQMLLAMVYQDLYRGEMEIKKYC